MNFIFRLDTGAKFSEEKKYVEAEELYLEIIADLESLKDDYQDENISRTQLLAKAYNNLGHILYKQVRFDEAIEKYSQAIQHDDRFAVAFYNRGTIHYRLGDYDLAIKDMEKSVLLDPSNSEFLTALVESKKVICGPLS